MADLQNDRKKNKKPIFEIFLSLYMLIFTLGIIFGLSTLYEYLDVYEKSLPIHAIESFMTQINDNYYQKTVADEINITTLEFEEYDSVREILEQAYTQSHTYTYHKKSDEYSDETPVYTIEADSNAFLKVTFKAAEEREKFGFPKWEVGSTEPLVNIEYEPEYSVRALLPEYGTLQINGVAVDDKYLIKASTPVPELELLSDFLEVMPTMKEYSVNGLYLDPVISAVDGNGELMNYSVENDGTYRFSFLNSEELKLEQEDYIIAMEKAYISFMINENQAGSDNFYALSKYIKSGTTLYSEVQSCSVSSNNPFNSREDKLISAENFVKYSEDCFSCDMIFNVKLTHNSFVKEFTGNLRWYFVNFDGTWLAVEMNLIS